MVPYQKTYKSSMKILILATLILFPFLHLKAGGAIVSNPVAEANQVTMLARMLEQINKATEALKRYDDMISKAQESINKINTVNDSINGVSNLIETSTMGIANPMDIVEQFKEMPERLGRNAERLANTIANFNIRDHWQWKRIGNVCPALKLDNIAPSATKLSYSKVGKESETVKAFKALGEALNSNIVSNSLAVMSDLKGRALALQTCLIFAEEQHTIETKKFQDDMKKCMLAGDQECYNEVKTKWIQAEIKYRKDTKFLRSQQVDPLINRSAQMLEVLGVMDKTYTYKDKEGNKKPYCKEGKDDSGQEFCYPLFYDTKRLNNEFIELQKDLLKKLKAAGKDKKAQAQAYADIKQKTDMMLLEYTKDIANNLTFMNETISLLSNLIARDYRHKYGDDEKLTEAVKAQVDKITQDYETNTIQYKGFQDYKANLDKYGFPIISFTGSDKDKDKD